MKTVRIGMLGCGFVAGFYAQGLRDVAGQELVVAASRQEESARNFAARWNIPEYTSDFERVIARDDIDLHLIALPNFLHQKIAVKLARAGRNQVCAKPLARNGGEAKVMLGAVSEVGVIYGYAETEVFAPTVVRAREIVRAGLAFSRMARRDTTGRTLLST